MFSSAAERDKWGPRFDSPPSTSAAASQANATGRKRKANFSNDETETLVWNVVRHFSALYGSESFRAHPVRRKQLWTQIQSRVNFLGYTERSIDDLKHKWRDLRLDVKKKITAKKPPPVHRPGPPHKPRLTPLEKMVASTFLQPTHDSEPEIVLDPAESGAELRTPEMSAISPPLRNESLVSYASEDEEQEGQEVEVRLGLHPSLEPQLSAEDDVKGSGRQALLMHRCNSQGSVASLPEDALSHADAHSDWGHEGGPDVPSLGRVLNPSQPEEEEEEEEEAANQSAELGSLPRGLMGPAWEKPEEEQQSGSPLHVGALTEESLPSSASPQADPGLSSQPLPRGMGCSRLREGSRDPWRTNIHHLMDMEDQWDQLYHQELAMWQEERAQQRDERARDRELQFRLLGVLTDIRDELRFLRQERAASRQERATSRQEQASQTVVQTAAPVPAASPPKPEAPSAETSPVTTPLFFPLKMDAAHCGPSPVRAGRGESTTAPRSPHGVFRRGRGRPRGSTSKHRRLFMTNS
ncbi:myb-related transcription factor, partner of profilin-like isoform X2 [Elgaria multicarinata webbii]|uniref:myb-related transcription factor, partner of profilin-like isoform X2 n=1 Tax=Elgaria multicarinata webbii TaxID=159646 RepID=UPI002FCCD7A6